MTDLLIPEGIIRIPQHQFKNLELEEITLPEGLQRISAHCFRNSKLRRVVIPSTVTRIDFGAFSTCDNLEEVVLPSSLRVVEPYAFSECENLRTVNIPANTRVKTGAFYDYFLHQGLCPWCGSALNDDGECVNSDRHAQSWYGELRLYKGLFWWDGEQLITVKVHCSPAGEPAYSVRFFGKRNNLRSHREEWKHLKDAGDPRVKGIRNYNDIPRGRVEIREFKATVFLHPELNQKEIVRKIRHEFGLSTEIHGLKDICFINDQSAHYRTNEGK